jgi:hypothetical protein
MHHGMLGLPRRTFQGLLGVVEELRCHGGRVDDLVSALIFGRGRT